MYLGLRRRRSLGALTGWCAIALTGCAAASNSGSTPPRLPVVSTVTQVSALTRAVGGDRIALTALLNPGDDPHQFEPRPADVAQLAQARVIVKSGAGLDDWLDRSLHAAGSGATVVDASRGVHLRKGSEKGVDPHWWYDAANAEAALSTIASALTAADPAGGATYQSNASAARRRMAAADGQIHALIDPIPVPKRLFVANHDAFNYFLARFGITLVGDVIPSTDTLSAIRPEDTARLVAAIRERHVRVLFTETTIDAKLVQQIATETGARVEAGKLYGDAIGEPGSPGGTLEGAMLADGRLMAQAFQRQ